MGLINQLITGGPHIVPGFHQTKKTWTPSIGVPVVSEPFDFSRRIFQTPRMFSAPGWCPPGDVSWFIKPMKTIAMN